MTENLDRSEVRHQEDRLTRQLTRFLSPGSSGTPRVGFLRDVSEETDTDYEHPDNHLLSPLVLGDPSPESRLPLLLNIPP